MNYLHVWSSYVLSGFQLLIQCDRWSNWPFSFHEQIDGPKDPTSPYRMHMGPPTESSVRNLLEKVGNLRDIAVLVQLNLAFLTFIDLHLHSQIVSDYHPLFLNGFF